MAGISPFRRLVRFENELGEVKYGEVAKDSLDSLVRSRVQVYAGDLPWDPEFKRHGETDIVHKVSYARFHIMSYQLTLVQVLAPLPYVPAFVCVGLNYKAHAAKMKVVSLS